MKKLNWKFPQILSFLMLAVIANMAHSTCNTVTNYLIQPSYGSCRYGNMGNCSYWDCDTRCASVRAELNNDTTIVNFACPSGCTIGGNLNDCSSGDFECSIAYSYVLCSTRCEADSLQCVTNGDNWTNTGASTCNGKSCKLSVCRRPDTQWLDSVKTACGAIGGNNNYAITEVGETCVHSGTCCPPDSVPSGNTCKWRCDSVLTTCEGRVGTLFGAVLPDTSISGQDTTFSYQCFYNCAHSPNLDSTVYLVEGNVVLSGPSDSISDGIKSETFNSFRTTSGGLYIYDYLSPAASEYVDSIAAMKCVEHLWRCVINNKYVYWYDNQEVPVGCTNIVRVK